MRNVREAEKPLAEIPIPENGVQQRDLQESRAEAKVGVLPENIAGSLAYLTFIPALVFLFVNPFRRSRFVRFHAMQCLLCWGAAVVLVIAFWLLGDVIFLIPTAGPLFVTIIDAMAALATLFIWLVLLVKAIQGEMFQLPLLGSLAERYAAANALFPAA